MHIQKVIDPFAKQLKNAMNVQKIFKRRANHRLLVLLHHSICFILQVDLPILGDPQ